MNRSLIFFLGILTSLIFAQEENIRYCRFDNLTWSPDGQNLIFDSYYIEEGLDKIAAPAILMKNIQTEKIVHLNPALEQFAIAADKKYLIFSSRFGLFLMELAKPENCGQIHFLNPAENKFLKAIGFFEVPKGIGVYWKMVDSWGEEVEVQSRQMNSIPVHSDSVIYWLDSQKVKKQTVKDTTSPVIDPGSARKNNHPCLEMKTKFVFKTVSPKTPDLLDLYQSDWNLKKEKKLLEKVRPRLFSYSPDSSRVVVSFWQEKSGEMTQLYHIKTQQMQKITNEVFKFVSWVSNTEFIGLTQSGLYRINLNQIKLQKLSKWKIPGAYKSNKTIRALTVANLKSVNKKAENKNWTAKIEDLAGDFIQSQIVLTNKGTRKSKVFIPPISNIKSKK
jgi:hypothetical protein